jgi:hypothetical protein
LKNGIVRIEADVVKNKEARILYLDDELKEVLANHANYGNKLKNFCLMFS